MIALWIRLFALTTFGVYVGILVARLLRPDLKPLSVEKLGLSQLETLLAIVIGIAWASAYTMWRYSRDKNTR
jgi:hypothetical protein